MKLLAGRRTTEAMTRRRADTYDTTWRPWWFVGMGIGVLAVALVVLLPAESGPWRVTYLATTAIASVVLFVCVLRMPRGVRAIWWSLLAFEALTIIADAIYDLQFAEQGAEFPGAADIFFMLAYIPVLVALGLLIRARHPGRDQEAWIDSVILSVAAASVLGAFLIAPVLADSGLTGAALAMAIAYPFLDVLVLCGLIWLLVGGGRPNPSLALLVLSFTIYLVGDVIRDATLSAGVDESTWAWLEALHLAALVVMAGAAAAPGARWVGSRGAMRRAPITGARILAMAVGVITVPILVAARIAGGPSAVTAVLAFAAIVIILLTIWRIAILVRQVESQRRLTQLVLDSTGDGIVGLDQEGFVVFANLSARRMLRCRDSDLVGRRFHDVAHHHHPDGEPFPWEECPVDAMVMSGGAGTINGQSYLRRDGVVFPVEILVSPLVTDGVVTGSVTSFRDVSERQAIAEVQRQFVSVVSHELRTPLTSIKGSLQMLDSGLFGEVTEEQQTLLTMAVNNSDRLGHLVNDILDLERLDDGRLPLHPERVGLLDLAAQAVAGITGAADAAGVEVSIQPGAPANDLMASVDPHRMVQVLTNLLGNAVKFSDRGSPVVVTASRDGDLVRVSVMDEGRGIPADKLDKVFDRFGQVDSGDARRYGGSGLGLTIAKELVTRSGGTIEVRSELGKGSTFTVVLPAATEAGDG